MNKFTAQLEKVLMPIAEKVEQNRYLSAIREGFTSLSCHFDHWIYFLIIIKFTIGNIK